MTVHPDLSADFSALGLRLRAWRSALQALDGCSFFDALLRCFPLAFSQLFLRAAAFLPSAAIARPPALPFHFDAADRCDNGALEVFQPRKLLGRGYMNQRAAAEVAIQRRSHSGIAGIVKGTSATGAVTVTP